MLPWDAGIDALALRGRAGMQCCECAPCVWTIAGLQQSSPSTSFRVVSVLGHLASRFFTACAD